MTTVSRREFMAVCGGACFSAVSGVVPCRAEDSFVRRTGLPLGVQLYTLDGELERDLDGTLAAVARIGYQRVEMAGFLGRSATELKAAFDRAGLQCHSAHIPFSAPGDAGSHTLEQEDQLVADARTIGWRYVIVPMFPLPAGIAPPSGPADRPRFFAALSAAMTADAWRACADRLNEKGARLAKANLRIGYHNHNVEFAPLGDSSGYQILMERTDPSLVCFEMDAGWVAAAGLDPAALLKRYPGRFRLMHVKDLKGTTRPNFAMQMDPSEVGSGSMDWRHLLPQAYAAGIRDFFVEQEPPFSISRLAAIEKSWRFLQGIAG